MNKKSNLQGTKDSLESLDERKTKEDGANSKRRWSQTLMECFQYFPLHSKHNDKIYWRVKFFFGMQYVEKARQSSQ